MLTRIKERLSFANDRDDDTPKEVIVSRYIDNSLGDIGFSLAVIC